MRVGELADRLAAQPDEDAGPPVARLEPAVVDDPRPAGERLDPPRPADLELGRNDRDAERAVGAGLHALDPDGRPEQAQVDLTGARRAGRRPGRIAIAQDHLCEESALELLVVERRPHAPRRGLQPDPARDRPPVVLARWRAPLQRPDRHAAFPQTPMGCQTVFISRNAAIHSGRSAARSSSQSNFASTLPAGRRERRFKLSAATSSTSVRSSSGTPQTSIASTSTWPARTGTSSLFRPVRTLTTPPGTSLVARTSVSVTAGSGRVSDARTSAALPATSGGASRETRPSSDDVSGATTPTTPVGSGIVKLKYDAATGFDDPRTWAILSAQPAYQTQRSMARATTSRAFASRRPSAWATSATNWSR